MVGALASLFDEANAVPEIRLCNQMRTGTDHEKAFRLEQLQTR